MFVAALPRKLTDAVTVVSGLSLFGAVLAWIGWLIGTLVFRKDMSIERVVIHGAGLGGFVGLLTVAVFLTG